ncbi:MAG: Hsp70 family protein [Janthinobacterium lividum]
MIPTIGIDLGTTFCCVSYIGSNGQPVVIPDLEGMQTTPSVVYFTGTQASFGRKAAARRHDVANPVYQFFKRDMGVPPAELGSKYKVGGYDYRAAGLQALLLRYLRVGAATHFAKIGLLDASQIATAELEAVITVPAYFREGQRRDTRVAGLAAGLRVAGIINEPTAAALTFGANLEREQMILVFDLGGGTFDVTIMRTGPGRAEVIASNGAFELGGRDWDELIENYAKQAYQQRTGHRVPDELLWQVQDQAVQAKIALSDAPQTTMRLETGTEVLELPLSREARTGFSFGKSAAEPEFVFESRSQDLLTKCRATLQQVLQEAGEKLHAERAKETGDLSAAPQKISLTWHDIDEIVLAGGASRMPMVAKMLAHEAGRPLTLVRPGFSYDTAISIGAALYASKQAAVTDVVAHSIGIELLDDAGRPFVELLLKQNTPIPEAVFEDSFEADANATLKVYEGESDKVRDYARGPLGTLQLGNPAGPVQVRLAQDAGGLIQASVRYGGKTLQKTIEPFDSSLNLDELTARIQAVRLELPEVR